MLGVDNPSLFIHFSGRDGIFKAWKTINRKSLDGIQTASKWPLQNVFHDMEQQLDCVRSVAMHLQMHFFCSNYTFVLNAMADGN